MDRVIFLRTDCTVLKNALCFSCKSNGEFCYAVLACMQNMIATSLNIVRFDYYGTKYYRIVKFVLSVIFSNFYDNRP